MPHGALAVRAVTWHGTRRGELRAWPVARVRASCCRPAADRVARSHFRLAEPAAAVHAGPADASCRCCRRATGACTLREVSYGVPGCEPRDCALAAVRAARACAGTRAPQDVRISRASCRQASPDSCRIDTGPIARSARDRLRWFVGPLRQRSHRQPCTPQVRCDAAPAAQSRAPRARPRSRSRPGRSRI